MRKLKSFYIWWITTLIAASAIFWAGYTGLLTEFWTQDHTFLTSILGVLFLYITYYNGKLAHNIDKLDRTIRQKMINRSFFYSEIAMGLAILGAAAAIILLLRVGLASTSVEDFAQVLISKWGELAPAFYPNAVGLAVSIYIKYQTYFIAEDYLDEE
jgi:ABC-type Na+ efflux pump permease subunit